METWRRENGSPALSVGVRLGGHPVLSHHMPKGTSALHFPAVMLIYSITKTFTAACILRLAQAGILKLEDPASRWFPRLGLQERITLRSLLQHTSGIRDYGPLPAYHAAVRASPSQPWSEEQFFTATLPYGLLFEPGNGWSYSNIGYLLLRRILEQATGNSFRVCIEQNIIKPLNLPHTTVPEGIGDLANLVPGYGTEISVTGEPLDIRPIYHPGWCAPGVAASTVEDITSFYERLGTLLNEHHLAAMFHLVRVPGNHPPCIAPSCGLGLLADPSAPFGPYYGHGGGGPGYTLQASILPDFPGGPLSLAIFCAASGTSDLRVLEYELLALAAKEDVLS